MGAAASVQQVYHEAMLWFKKYFDSDMYEEDFKVIDRNSDGVITYKELHSWIKKKADTEKGMWALLINREEILQLAHHHASRKAEAISDMNMIQQKIVDAHDFKRLLIHLFAISTMWVHFKNADDWVQSSDFGNLQLSLDEFKLACSTLNASYRNEQVSDQQLSQDFDALDTNKDGYLEFIEVCDYCCQYLDKAGYQEILGSPAKPGGEELLEALTDIPTVEVEGEEETSTDHVPNPVKKNFNKDLEANNSLHSAYRFHSVEEKNKMAMEALAGNMEKNQKLADFAEIKFNTEKEVLSQLSSL